MQARAGELGLRRDLLRQRQVIRAARRGAAVLGRRVPGEAFAVGGERLVDRLAEVLVPGRVQRAQRAAYVEHHRRGDIGAAAAVVERHVRVPRAVGIDAQLGRARRPADGEHGEPQLTGRARRRGDCWRRTARGQEHDEPSHRASLPQLLMMCEPGQGLRGILRASTWRTSMADVFIYDSLRTPRGRGKAGKGGLANIHPQELLAQTLNHMAERKKLDKNLVDDLAVGCVTQVKEQGACIARVALIAAEWPEDVTGFTINRFCGSGLEGVNSIAAKIGAGFIDGGIGGGVESMSRVPMGSDGSMLDGNNEKLRKRLFLVPQGISADLIATREGFTRADVDKFALASQQKAARAIEAKRFDLSLFGVKNDDGSVALARDEHPRADTTLESLGGLQPAFAQMGATPMGPKGETLDQLALQRYSDTKVIDHVHT